MNLYIFADTVEANGVQLKVVSENGWANFTTSSAYHDHRVDLNI